MKNKINEILNKWFPNHFPENSQSREYFFNEITQTVESEFTELNKEIKKLKDDNSVNSLEIDALTVAYRKCLGENIDLDNLRFQRQKLIEDVDYYKERLNRFENRVKNFNKINYFKRVWIVICGNKV